MMRDADRTTAPALSRPLAVADVPPEGLDVVVTASPKELAALAEANDLPAVLSLEAPLRATRGGRDGLNVDGEVRAVARRVCVVTLEEFDEPIAETVHLRFAPPKTAPAPARTRHPRGKQDDDEDWRDMTGDDPPDPLIGGAVDLGAIASEFLTLGLDPYPRKPGANFAEAAPVETQAKPASPFARIKDAAAAKTPGDDK